jgi:Rieske Fe-S protein
LPNDPTPRRPTSSCSASRRSGPGSAWSCPRGAGTPSPEGCREPTARRTERPPVRALLDRIQQDTTITRRDYLRILVTVSGGLFAGTAAVALGLFRRRDEATAGQVRVAEAIAPGSFVRFHYPTDADPAIAIRLGDGTLVGYSAVCTHLSCAVLWNPNADRIDCPCHDGAFDPRDGGVLAGPPPRPLPGIELVERSGGIFAIAASPGGLRGGS